MDNTDLSLREVSPRRQATLDRLLAAARLVIAQRGLAAASVEEICERAGFSRGAFYSNFTTKDDLVVALLRDLAQQRIATIVRATAMWDREGTGLSLVDALRIAVQAANSTGLGVEEVILITELQLWAIRNPDFREVHDQLVNAALTRLGDDLVRLVERYDAELLVDGQVLARMVHAVFDYSRLHEVLDGPNVTVRPGVDSLLEMCVRPKPA